MVDTNFYDVVVCGGETAGLVAAALLARRGYRVLVVGDEPEQAALEAGGTALSRAPALLPPLDDPQALRVFKELDCVAVVKRRAPVAPGIRLAIGQQRIDVTADPAALERELARAFAASGPMLLAGTERLDALGRTVEPLLATAMTLPPNGFWERREVGRLESLLPRAGTDPLAPLGTDHPFRAAAAAPAALSTNLAPGGVGSVTEARAFALARRGVHPLEGGLAALQELLHQRIETFGGERRRRLEPVSVVVRRGRAVGLSVRPRDETIGCQWLLWSGSSASLRTMLGSAAPPAPARGRPAALRVTGYRYAVSLLVGPRAVPAGTPARLIAVGDPSRALLEDNAIAVTIGQPAPREPDRIPIWIECTVPAHLVDAGPSYLRALRGRLLQTLERLWPELGKELIVAASPYDGLGAQRGPGDPPAAAKPTAKAAAETTGAKTPAKPASSVAVVPPPVYARPAGGPLDITGLPHATGVKNLLLVGRENLPGLGLEGDLVSGWGAARLVGHAPVRRVPLRRRTLLGG
jgi:phytoene dehydrogenase-like protein